MPGKKESLISIDFDYEPLSVNKNIELMEQRLFSHQCNDKNIFIQLRQENLDWMSWAELPDDVTDVVHIGIGGSIVGMQALATMMYEHQSPSRQLYFISSLDDREFYEVTKNLNPDSTIIYVVSKSLGSIEPLANLELAKQFFNQSMDRLRVVTTNGDKAASLGFLEKNIQLIPEYTSGRYSVWGVCSASIVSVFGKSLFQKFFNAAKNVDQSYLERTDFYQDICKWAAIDLHKISLNWVKIIACYGYRSRNLPEYFTQLHHESLGKTYTHEGSRVDMPVSHWLLTLKGTEFQHSSTQMIMQGQKPCSIDWVVSSSHQNMYDQAVAHAKTLNEGYVDEDSRKCIQGQRGSIILDMKETSVESLGQLMAMYEHKIWLLGYISGINVFDQWGVERVKAVARSLVQ